MAEQHVGKLIEHIWIGVGKVVIGLHPCYLGNQNYANWKLKICQSLHRARLIYVRNHNRNYPSWKLKLSALSIDYAPGFYAVALGQSLWKKEGEKYMFVSLGRGGIRVYQYTQWANILLEQHQQQKFRENAKKKKKEKKKEKERVKMNEAFCNSSYMGQPTFYTVTQTSWLKEVLVIWITLFEINPISASFI